MLPLLTTVVGCAIMFVTVVLCSDLWATESTQHILRRADEARGNLEGITWEVVLEAVEQTHTTTMTFDVKARAFDIVVANLAPPQHKGNTVLMLQGNMWFYKPRLSKPVPISQRQKLLGNAAYGDIAATNYAQDYTATVLADDTVNGELCAVFDLLAKDKKATYDRIKYWIAKGRLVGIKAEYFTVSGKKFKSATMEYANTVTIDGEERPFISHIRIHDELLSHDVTTLTFHRPRFQRLPDHLFNLNLLVK